MSKRSKCKKEVAEEAVDIVREEYRNPPELRTVRRLQVLGLTQDDILALDIPEALRNAVYTVMRDVERTGEYSAMCTYSLWLWEGYKRRRRRPVGERSRDG